MRGVPPPLFLMRAHDISAVPCSSFRLVLAGFSQQVTCCVSRFCASPNIRLNLFHKLGNNISTKMQDVRHSPYGCNAFVTAVREGKIDRVKEIISSRGPCYAAEWRDGYSLLCTALEKKHTEVAKLLLTSGSKVNSRYKHPDNTPLHFAVLIADIEIVQMLLDRGANIDARNILGKTPLHNAVESINTEIVDMLLSRGAKVDAADKSSVTPLHLAIMSNSQEITSLLLSRGANVDGTTSGRSAADRRDGCIPLYLAVEKGHEEVVKVLLEWGASIDGEDKDDKTILRFAVEKGSSIIVEHILKRRPNLNDKSNSSILNIAVQGYGIEYRKIVSSLLEYGFTVNPKDANNSLHVAVEKGYVELVEELLKHCTDVNMSSDSTSGNGYTPLHVATKNRDEKVAKLLISYGVDVNAPDEIGKTPIFYATENADLTMVKLLLTNKANASDDPELLINAVSNEYREMVEVLLQHDADVNMSSDSTSGNGYTPLHVATKNRDEKVAKLLISYGADVNASDEIGKTPIFYATENADLTMVKLLLTNKANASDDPELLINAVRNEYREMVEVLLQHGADVNAVDKCGRMPLVVVILKKPDINTKEEIARLLSFGGFNVNSRGKNSRTILHYGTEDSHAKLIEVFERYKFRYANVLATKRVVTLLHLSVLIANNEIIEMLLNEEADVNAEDGNGETALHYATEKGNGKVVELLLKCGAKVDAGSNYTRATPLQIAVEFSYLNIIKLLLKFGAKVDSTIKRCMATSFHRAARLGHLELVNLLLKLDVNVDSADDWGRTALYSAYTENHERIVTALLEHGADVTIKSNNQSVLDFAVYSMETILPGNFAVIDVKVAKVLMHHMVKIKAANLYAVNDARLSIPPHAISRDHELRDFQNECKKEVASMKSEKFVNTYITFYDILTKDVKQLAMFARNENIAEAFRSDNYKIKFPIYASMINRNFRKGEERKEFLEHANKILELLFNDFYGLPRNCTEIILSYLNDEDLRPLMGDDCKPIVFC